MTGAAYDVVVLGGGPGGYVAAIRARQLGLATALVERENLGGICLNWGCIPTKALLRAADLRHLLGEIGKYGLSAGEVHCDFDQVVARSRAVAARLSAGVRHLMRKNGVEVIAGHGRLLGGGRLAVDTGEAAAVELEAPHIILATGARARGLPGIRPDGELIWTYKEALAPARLPASLLIVGAGAIGVELASFYRDMGSEVTLIEMAAGILPLEDEEIGGLARRSFERRGIRVHTEATVQAIERGRGSVTAVVDLGGGMVSPVSVERVILAVGITGNVEDLGLDATRVRVDRGHVVVDRWLRTDEPGVYAVGDLVGPPWLAHKASHEGVVCVEHLAGMAGVEPLDVSNIPACTYCRPQVASIGLGEADARAAGREVRVGRFPYRANGKALALGEEEGLVKVIFDAEGGALLGAHLIGAEATELIHGFAVAKTLETTEAELMRTVFPHPTLSEMLGEAVLDAYGRALNI